MARDYFSIYNANLNIFQLRSVATTRFNVINDLKYRKISSSLFNMQSKYKSWYGTFTHCKYCAQCEWARKKRNNCQIRVDKIRLEISLYLIKSNPKRKRVFVQRCVWINLLHNTLYLSELYIHEKIHLDFVYSFFSCRKLK